jgi:hypothetical protein
MSSNEEIAAAAAIAAANNATVDLPPIKVGFVIDGVLVDVLHTDDRLGAIFLSEPTMVDVTNVYETLVPKSTYNKATGQFTAPE